MVNTWKIVLATVIIFGAGVVTGGLLVGHANRAKAKQQRAMATVVQAGHWTPPLREFPRRPEQELQRLLEQRRIEFMLNTSRELSLTPQQRERIERLVVESQERIRKLWEQVGPQIRKEPGTLKEKIREELKPPQRKRFEELMKRPQQVRRPGESPAPNRAAPEIRRPTPPPAVAPPPNP